MAELGGGGIRRQQIDPEGGRGPARTVQPADTVERETCSFLACWTVDTMTELGNSFIGLCPSYDCYQSTMFARPTEIKGRSNLEVF